MEIVKNEFYLLEEENNIVYLTVYQKGFPLIMISTLLAGYPRLVLKDFKKLKDAVEQGTEERVQVGEQKPELECNITNDKMTAKVRLNCLADQLEENYSDYVSKVLSLLREHNVSEGIMLSVIENDLVANKDIVVAAGREPISGKDAVVTYYKRASRKPTIREDGKADYYDMKFIDEVKTGDWLGEKIPATEGIAGVTIFGDFLMAPKGKNKKIHYDKKTVGEFNEEDKIVLRALIDGVVDYQGGKILVGDHLVIDGDIGIGTGNISFNGSVTVNGTVMDGYSVTATKDISILSELGVCQIGIIESTFGDVFIKGGVFGKGKSLIRAGKNVFVKHANECFIEAGENINIGYYSLGSTLKANNIITDEKRGKLIGGVIEATGKVKAAIIGNRMERKTIIHVTGFDREKVKVELDGILESYKQKVMQVEKLKQKIDVFDSFLEELNALQNKQYEELKNQFDKIMVDIFHYEEKRKNLMGILDSKGEGEVTIGQIAFPDTTLKIKNLNKKLNSETKGTFYFENNYMHFE